MGLLFSSFRSVAMRAAVAEAGRPMPMRAPPQVKRETQPILPAAQKAGITIRAFGDGARKF
ncbi:MAG: hypothetical protein Kow00133_00380 [Amphiplicatus sp.]